MTLDSEWLSICRLDTTSDMPKKERLNYEYLKERVLEVGRFSCFEASESLELGRLFTRLCHDPELVTDNENPGYPWTSVRRREVPKP
jgi:hypothetical protein